MSVYADDSCLPRKNPHHAFIIYIVKDSYVDRDSRLSDIDERVRASTFFAVFPRMISYISCFATGRLFPRSSFCNSTRRHQRGEFLSRNLCLYIREVSIFTRWWTNINARDTQFADSPRNVSLIIEFGLISASRISLLCRNHMEYILKFRTRMQIYTLRRHRIIVEKNVVSKNYVRCK